MKWIFLLLLNFHIAGLAQTKVIKFDALERLMESKVAEVHVINFWATWCAPCVKELPIIEKVGQEKPAVKITLINLDFADKVEKVNSFIARKNIKSEVLLLDEIDYNAWIDRVEKSWGGAIPATLIVNTKTGKRKFIDKELKEGDLEKFIEETK
jgi:thiol-disulfide isomerase/thioredoxin